MESRMTLRMVSGYTCKSVLLTKLKKEQNLHKYLAEAILIVLHHRLLYNLSTFMYTLTFVKLLGEEIMIEANINNLVSRATHIVSRPLLADQVSEYEEREEMYYVHLLTVTTCPCMDYLPYRLLKEFTICTHTQAFTEI